MSGERTSASILHADLDAFYASVEQRDHPELRGRAIVVGKGVVLSASYEARARGVRTAMGGSMARRLCPEVVAVAPRMSAYSEASRAVMAIFEDFAPVVEPLSIDEAFLDVSGLERISGAPRQIAVRLRHTVRERAGLPLSVGVARTKFLAKVASAVAKPDGLLVVEPDRELDFLHPLPVERVWGVGAVTARKLHNVGVHTVAELAAYGEERLIGIVGRAAGRHLFALATGRDPRPVRARRRRRSVGAQRALGRRPRSDAELLSTLAALIDRVSRRLRRARRSARTVVLRLRFGDYARATRSRTLLEPTAETGKLLEAATALLTACLPMVRARGLTLVGVALTNLTDAPGGQLSLFDQAVALDVALDTIRDRYGSGAIVRGSLVGRDQGPWVPLLPD